MFEKLSQKIDLALKTLKGHGRITEVNVSETMKEIRRALIDADVNYKIAKSFVDRVKVKALGSKVLTSLKPGQLMIKIVQDELTELLGGNKEDLKTSGKPAIILLSGLPLLDVGVIAMMAKPILSKPKCNSAIFLTL